MILVTTLFFPKEQIFTICFQINHHIWCRYSAGGGIALFLRGQKALLDRNRLSKVVCSITPGGLTVIKDTL